MKQLEKHDRLGLGIMGMISALIALAVAGAWYLDSIFNNDTEASLPNELLRQRCEAEFGVLIEGVTDTESDTTRFSVCVPERAFECIDVE